MDKMKIFISWSGPRSGAVAEALKEYLPMINNTFDPWLSSADIEKGSRSTTEIAEALATAKAGIICLTPNNLTAPWILFEAGGVAKTVDRPLACTLLIDLESSAVSPPLGDFQHTRLTEKELLQLMKTLNRALGEGAREDTQIEKAFRLCWPELKERLDKLPKDEATERPERTQQDVLAEILDTVRRNQQDTAQVKQVEEGNVRGIAEILARLPNLTSVGGPHISVIGTGAVTPGLGPQFAHRLSPLYGDSIYGGNIFTPEPPPADEPRPLPGLLMKPQSTETRTPETQPRPKTGPVLPHSRRKSTPKKPT